MRGHIDDEDRWPDLEHVLVWRGMLAGMAEMTKRARPDYEPVPLPRIVSEVVERVKGEL